MGYTHYFKQIPELPENKWNPFIEEVRTTLKDATNIQFDFNVNSPPQIDSEIVRFNGIGNQGHETFFFPRLWEAQSWETLDDNGRYFNFCKTAQKPYDIHVVKILMLVEKHFGDDVEIDSDGDWENIKKQINERKLQC